MKTSAAITPPPWPLGLSEPDGLLHVQADGFWSLCCRRTKAIRPQQIAATWPRCPQCQEMERTIQEGLMEDLAEPLAGVMTRNLPLAERIAEQVMHNFLARPLQERVQAYWLMRQELARPQTLLMSATCPPRPASRPWPSARRPTR